VEIQVPSLRTVPVTAYILPTAYSYFPVPLYLFMNYLWIGAKAEKHLG